MHYYKRNIGDYHKKAGRLSMLEHGAYTLLMDACYDREEWPTLKEAMNWTWASTKEEREAVQFILERFFTKNPAGSFEQKRIGEEIKEYSEFREKQRQRGKKGGRPKKSEPLASESHTLNKVNPPGSPEKPKPLTTNQEPLTTNREPNNNSSAVNNISEFDEYSESKLAANNHSIPSNGYKKISGWKLGPETREMLTTKYKIPEKFIGEEIDSFIRFWTDRGGEKLSWDSAFLKQCQAQWKRNGGQWTDGPTQSTEQESADFFDKVRKEQREGEANGP